MPNNNQKELNDMLKNANSDWNNFIQRARLRWVLKIPSNVIDLFQSAIIFDANTFHEKSFPLGIKRSKYQLLFFINNKKISLNYYYNYEKDKKNPPTFTMSEIEYDNFESSLHDFFSLSEDKINLLEKDLKTFQFDTVCDNIHLIKKRKYNE